MPGALCADQPQGASAMRHRVALIIGVVRTSVGPYSPGAPANVARTSAVWPFCRSTVNFSAGRPRSTTDGPVVVASRPRAPRRRSSPRRPDRRGTPRCGRSRRACCRCTRGSSMSCRDVEPQSHLDRVGRRVGRAGVRRDRRLGVQVVVDLRRRTVAEVDAEHRGALVRRRQHALQARAVEECLRRGVGAPHHEAAAIRGVDDRVGHPPDVVVDRHARGRRPRMPRPRSTRRTRRHPRGTGSTPR